MSFYSHRIPKAQRCPAIAMDLWLIWLMSSNQRLDLRSARPIPLVHLKMLVLIEFLSSLRWEQICYTFYRERRVRTWTWTWAWSLGRQQSRGRSSSHIFAEKNNVWQTNSSRQYCNHVLMIKLVNLIFIHSENVAQWHIHKVVSIEISQ